MATIPKGQGHIECRATTTGETETPTQSNWPCGLNELEAMSPDELIVEIVRTQDRVEDAVQEMGVLIRLMAGRLREDASA